MMDSRIIEKRDGAGRLAAVAVEWDEGREGLLSAKVLGAGLLWIVGIVLGTIGSVFFLWWPIALILGGALVWGGFSVLNMDLPGTPRRLEFCRDGRILAPLGFSYYPPRFREVSGGMAVVASIEARQITKPDENTPFTHGVVIYKRSGDISYVATTLYPDAAHKVAVQLTAALVAMREEISSSGVQSAKPTASKLPRAMALID